MTFVKGSGERGSERELLLCISFISILFGYFTIAIFKTKAKDISGTKTKLATTP